MPVWNVEAGMVKVYNAIKVEANMIPTLTYFYSLTPIQQSTDLEDIDYNNLEGYYYATLYRNKLVPTEIGYSTNGLLTGDKIRTFALNVLIELTVTNTPLELRFVTLFFDISRGHH